MGGNAQQAAPAYTYKGSGTADSQALNYTQNALANQNWGSVNQPQLQGIATNVAGGGGYDQSGAVGAGNQLIGQTQSLVPYAQQTLQTGFDPQHALYNQQFQQNTDQTRAAQAAQGVAGTPYGAGGEVKSDQDFNMNWQNQQLARQGQAAQNAGSLLGTAGKSAAEGTAVGQGVNNNNMQALLTANQGGAMENANTQQVIQDFLSYLQGGTQASGTNAQITDVNNKGQQQNFNNMQTWLTDLGQGAGSFLGF